MRHLLLVALLLLPGCVGHAARHNATEAVVLKVEGLNCPYCADTLKTYLVNTPGIARVEVDLKNRLVRVAYDPAVTSGEEIINLPIFAAYGGAELVNSS